MKSNVKEAVTDAPKTSEFIPHFTMPMLGGAKFTPKVAFKDMPIDKAEKLLRSQVPDTVVTGSVNTTGYGVFAYSVKGIEVGTISFYPSELDESSTQEEINTTANDLVEKLKTTPITQAIADGSDLMANW